VEKLKPEDIPGAVKTMKVSSDWKVDSGKISKVLVEM